MNVIVTENDRFGWQKAYEEVMRLTNDIDHKVEFTVRLNSDSEVTNLRYAFPIVSYLKRKNLMSVFTITGSDRDVVSAKTFLRQMVDYGALVIYNGISFLNQRIFDKYIEKLKKEYKELSEWEKELIRTAIAELKEANNKNAGSEKTESSVADQQQSENTLDFYLVYPNSCKKDYAGRELICIDLLKRVISEIKNVSVDNVNVRTVDTFETNIKALEINSNAYSYMYPSDIFPLLEIKQNDSISDEKIKCLIKFFKDSTVNLKEFTFPKANAKEKRSVTEIQSRVKSAIPDFSENSFAELIFYYLLRNMYYHKRAFWTEGNTVKVDVEFINKIALDSRSYAEGLWQLIENAYVHSQGKTAYFGMRVYKANTETSMGDISKEANTREWLWKKYWLNKNKTDNVFNETDSCGNKQYRDFIEFYVLDDAVNTKDGMGQGVLDTLCFGNNIIKKGKLPKSIEGVFNLSEDDYAKDSKVTYYIQHYGMRWLHKHVNRLHGIIQVFSPCASAVVNYEGEKYIEKSNLCTCCYTNQFDAMRLFASSIFKGGDVEVNVKDIKDYKEQFNANRNEDDSTKVKLIPYCNFYSTEYSILIPISYKVHEPAQNLTSVKELAFDYDFGFYGDAEYKFLDKCVLVPNASKEENICNIVNVIRNKAEALQINEKNNIPYILSISLREWDFCTIEKVELLAKALFKYIYEIHSINSSIKLFFTVNFKDEKYLMQEFIRVFSIFYDKQGENKLMENVQIALCSDDKMRLSDDKVPFKAIEFIIAGKDLQTSYLTASSFVYHNEAISINHIPVLDYLCPQDLSNTDKGGEDLKLCPFELVQTEGMGGNDFLKQINKKINTDQRTDEYGCKLSNIYVKLGSKVVIKDFYEAELLFHNIGNIKRFAYLIARDIYKNEQKRREAAIDDKSAIIALLGYENYSSILTQEIMRLLESISREKELDYKLFFVSGFHDSGKAPKVSFENVSTDIKEDLIKGEMPVVCYTIVPVGATLTTFHKLHESFKRGLNKLMKDNGKDDDKTKYSVDVNFYDNYLLVAVGDCYFGTDSEISKKYISKVNLVKEGEKGWNTAVAVNQFAEDASHSRKPPLKVKFCVAAKSEWYDPFNEYEEIEKSNHDDMGKKKAPAKHTSKPLLKVDKTSTLLDTIFQSTLTDEVLDFYSKGSIEVELLEPELKEIFVKYGHIHLLDNHYQFFFDFDKIVNKQANKDKIIQWAKTIKIDSNAFNIVISPLQNSNSSFLKIILDNVFGSSLHLLHIDVNCSSKEMIRTKFLYICNELRMIKNAYSKVNFYFVDDSICTGATISRAQKLILMLLDHSGILKDKQAREEFSVEFKKVILLLNRNSYETARAWVNNPNEDWCGFINLCVPSYNTHADKCPACYVQERFNRLEKRSATKEMVRHFKKIAYKHQKREREKFESFLANALENDPIYYDWLQTYVVTHSAIFEDGDKMKQAIAKFEEINTGSDRKPATIATMFEILAKDEPQNIKDEYKLIKKDCLEQLAFVVGKEHYQRLLSMNEAYKNIIYNKKLHKLYSEGVGQINDDKPFESFKENLILEIFSLLHKSLDEDNYYDRILGFISYLKVISRDYLAKTYYVREAIFIILHCVFIIITEDFGNPDKIKNAEDFKEYLITLSKKSDLLPLKAYFLKFMSNQNFYNGFYRIWQRIRVEIIYNSFDCRVVYRLVKVVGHRLAQMNSSYIIKKDVIEDVIKAYNRLYKKDHNNKLPSQEVIVDTYLASIKTATMSVDDDKMCFDLLELYKGWCKNE